MPRTPAQYKAMQERRKAKILQCALKLFATEGFDNVAITDIAKEAGCVHGLIYHYYPTKENILEALVNRAKCGIDLIPPLKEAKESDDSGLSIFASYYERVQRSNKNEASYFALLWLSLENQEKAKGLPFLKDLNVRKGLLSLIKKEKHNGSAVDLPDEILAETWIYLANGVLNDRIAQGLKNHKVIPAESFLHIIKKD